MNGILNESTVVEEKDFNEPDIHEKKIIYLLVLLKIVEISTFILSNIDLFMILTLQKFLIMEESISQLLIDLWNLKLNSML